MLSLRTSEKYEPDVKRKVGFQGGSEPWLAESPAPNTPGPSLGQIWTISSLDAGTSANGDRTLERIMSLNGVTVWPGLRKQAKGVSSAHGLLAMTSLGSCWALGLL